MIFYFVGEGGRHFVDQADAEQDSGIVDGLKKEFQVQGRVSFGIDKMIANTCVQSWVAYATMDGFNSCIHPQR